MAPPNNVVANTLKANRLGVAHIVFFVMSAATPLTVTAGVVTAAYATTGMIGLPIAFVVVALILTLFSIGYVTMARHVGNCGAFYSYLSQGLGRPMGVGGAWVALLAYNALQIGLYGAIGAATAPLLHQWFGLHATWWLIALPAWAMTATLGLLRVDVNGRILAVLVIAETAIILVFSTANTADPSTHGTSLDALNPTTLMTHGAGALLALAVLGFIGFESTVVFSEETKDPQRTVPIATYLSVGMIGILYAFSSWAMTVATGPDRIVTDARQQGTELLFNLAAARLGNTMATLGHTLFVTALLAGMVAFHGTTSRYMYALGREGVLPTALGRTSMTTGSPANASLLQSGIALVVILTYAIVGWDPLITLFYYGGTSGAIGVLLLITATSISVVNYFLAHRATESLWRSRIAPSVATILLVAVTGLTLSNIDTLLGVPPTHLLVRAVPVVYLTVAFLGAMWGCVLNIRRPDIYARIGMGAKSVLLTTPSPTSNVRPGLWK